LTDQSERERGILSLARHAVAWATRESLCAYVEWKNRERIHT